MIPWEVSVIAATSQEASASLMSNTPNLPTNIIPTKIAWLKLSWKFPTGQGISPLKIKIMLESDPLKSIMLVRRLGVYQWTEEVRFQENSECSTSW